MLDDIERRAFLVKPAREDPVPQFVGALDIDLNEGAGQPLGFPRCAGLTRPQANDDVFHSYRLARFHCEVAHDPVALVEQADDSDPLSHRGGTDLIDNRGQSDLVLNLVEILFAHVASGQQGERQSNRGDTQAHAWSGVHAI